MSVLYCEATDLRCEEDDPGADSRTEVQTEGE